MSDKKIKEIRLHQSGKFSVVNVGYTTNMGAILYMNNYSYTSCYDKESDIKKAKKMLCKQELKNINKELKRLEDKKIGILKHKL
jgi:hypothetical protein